MLSDEERKAIDSLKIISEYAGDNYLAKEHRRKLKLLIELVEKQSKEIEEAEQKEKKAYIDGTNIAHELCNKYWQDKIKAKMKEKEWSLENYDCSDAHYKQSQAIGAWSILQSLLEKE